MKRKYPKVTGWWVYVIKTPDNMYYPGCSGQQPSQRWQVRCYKKLSLCPYIEQFGWENLEKVVLTDGLTKEQALKLEDRLICMYTKLGCCINQQRSGWIRKKDEKEYEKQRYQNHKNEKCQYAHSYYKKHYIELKEYRDSHKEEKCEYDKLYYEAHKEEIKEKRRQRYKTTRIMEQIKDFDE